MIAKKIIPNDLALNLLERFQSGVVIPELCSDHDFGPAIIKRTLISLLGKNLYAEIAHRSGQVRFQAGALKANLGHSRGKGKSPSGEARANMSRASRRRLQQQGYDFIGRDEELERRRKIRNGQLVVGPKRSQTEQYIFHFLLERFPDAVHSYRVFYEKDSKKRRIIFDVFIPSQNLIVEINGDYWHCNPDIYQWHFWDEYRKKFAYQIWQRDLERHSIALEKGYTVKILWQKNFEGRAINDFPKS